MQEASELVVTIGPGISRAHFASRLTAFLLVSVGLVVALRVGQVLVLKSASQGKWPDHLVLGILILGSLCMVAASIFNLYFFFTKAVVPRLTDVGLFGPIRSLMAVLTFVFPLSILLLLLMLFAPANYVPERKPGKKSTA